MEEYKELTLAKGSVNFLPLPQSAVPQGCQGRRRQSAADALIAL